VTGLESLSPAKPKPMPGESGPFLAAQLIVFSVEAEFNRPEDLFLFGAGKREGPAFQGYGGAFFKALDKTDKPAKTRNVIGSAAAFQDDPAPAQTQAAADGDFFRRPVPAGRTGAAGLLGHKNAAHGRGKKDT
jgi:hypothetical protein